MLVIKELRVAPCSQIRLQTQPGMSLDPKDQQWTASITWIPSRCFWRHTVNNSTSSKEIVFGHGMKAREGRYLKRRWIITTQDLRELFQFKIMKFKRALIIKATSFMQIVIETAASPSRAIGWSTKMSCQNILIRRNLLYSTASHCIHYFLKRINQAGIT